MECHDVQSGPVTISITIPAKAWRVLGLASWKQSGESIWQAEAIGRSRFQHAITMDVDTAKYLRTCGKIAAADRRAGLNERERNAAWCVVARITLQLQRRGIERA